MSEVSGTRRRLVDAASRLFAERGFHATTMRDIASHAEVNVAAANYHYGSKRDLYLEVLRDQFAAVRSMLDRRGASLPAESLADLERDDLVLLLRRRLQATLDLLLGPPPGVQGTLMLREMLDPSEALPTIASEFVQPMLVELEQILAPLAPGLDASTLRRCAFGVLGQALFYRAAMPAVLQILGREAYPRGFSGPLAAHMTDFALGGLAHVEARPRPTPPSRPRSAASRRRKPDRAPGPKATR